MHLEDDLLLLLDEQPEEVAWLRHFIAGSVTAGTVAPAPASVNVAVVCAAHDVGYCPKAACPAR